VPQEVTVKQLLEAGVHFGHHTNRWNPKMERYIFTDRNKVYIIDLEKTLTHLKVACEFLRGVAGRGGAVLLVGTKRQAQPAILEIAQKTDMPYVNQRWLGGMLTNFETIRKSVSRLDELEKMEEEGTYQFLTKKEVAGIRTKRAKLLKVLVGVRHMKRLPDALFVVDPKQEEIAVREARKLNIPVTAIVDTNCDPDVIDYPIPGNDDAIRSVKLICDVIGSALEEGRNQCRAVLQEVESASTEDAAEDATETKEVAEVKETPEEKKGEKLQVGTGDGGRSGDTTDVPVTQVIEKATTEQGVKRKLKPGRPKKEIK